MPKLAVLSATWLFVTLDSLCAIAQSPLKCPKGYQPYGERCVTQRMADYISCIEASGANHQEITEEVNQVANKQFSGDAKGAGSGVVAKGSGSIVVNTNSEKDLVKRFQQKWYSDAMKQCASVLEPTPRKSSSHVTTGSKDASQHGTPQSGTTSAPAQSAPSVPNSVPTLTSSAISFRMGCEIDHLPIHILPASSIHVIRIHPSILYGNPRFQDGGVFENITAPADKALDWPTDQQGRWMTAKESEDAMAAGMMPLPYVSKCTLRSYGQTTIDEIVASLIIGLPDKTKPKSTTPVPVRNLSFPVVFDPLMSGQSFQFYLVNTCSSGVIPLTDQWGDYVTIRVLGESESRTVPLRYQRTSLPGSLSVVMATMGPTSFIWNDLHDCQWEKKP
jgi:hypothetical protein